MDQVKKRQTKKVLGWIAMAAVAALLAAMPMLADAEVETDGPKASILSGAVETGTVETALHGGGVLAEEAGVEVTVPAGVKLTKFLVSGGDAVAAGDPVAEADRVSIMDAIVRVQEELDALARQMAGASGAEASAEVTAQAGGRVKLVYAQAGDDVRDVMLEHGALAVLSLDGRMAVEFSAEEVLYVGDKVTVTFADGTEVPGRMESSLGGTVVVSVEDEDYPVGTEVTVTFADGTVLGSGGLRVHNAWNAVAWSGTVEEVSVEAGETVEAGDVLLTLTDTAASAEFERLARQHREYEAVMQALFRLYEDGTVRAPRDGVVSRADDDSELLAENGAAGEYDPLEDTVLLSVVPQDTMTVTITVDERDMAKLSVGQSARVRVNALKDREFDAVVTGIGTRGENAGGSSKFTVEMTLDRAADMLSGMNATVSITLGTAEQVPVIPVEALCEIGSQTVVYTGYDADTGTLTGPVTVTTGASDGVMVQILSGLEAGQTYYYSYYDTLELSTDLS